MSDNDLDLSKIPLIDKIGYDPSGRKTRMLMLFTNQVGSMYECRSFSEAWNIMNVIRKGKHPDWETIYANGKVVGYGHKRKDNE